MDEDRARYLDIEQMVKRELRDVERVYVNGILQNGIELGNNKPSPLCPLCNIHTHDTHHLFNCTHIRTTLSPLDLWTDPAGVTALLARWTEKLAGGPQAGTSDSPH